MLAWSAYAFIVNGTVDNVGVFKPDEYDRANYIAHASYGEFAMAVDVTHIPVSIGDIYEDGVFYRIVETEEGTKRIEVEPYPTEANRISVLENMNAELTNNLTSVELALVEMAESEV